ncbi:MAG: transcription-repair coupling factor [Candidatus Alectryocaccobium sp.]|nr:transcription-repair coupling factor [Candidatus Alectryocaccobium sp.]
MNALRTPITEINGIEDTVKSIMSGKASVNISGCLESQKVNAAAALIPEDFKTLVIAENDLKARQLYEDWQLYDKDVILYPARDMIFYQAAVSGNPVERARIKAIRALIEQKKATVITSAGGCMDFLLPFDVFKNKTISIAEGEEIELDRLSKKLTETGYERTAQVEKPGEYAIRGGIVDIFDMTEDNPYRIELWGDEVDSIRYFDCESQKSFERAEIIDIFPATEEIGRDKKDFFESLKCTFPDYFGKKSLFIMDEPARIGENAKAVYTEFTDAMAGRIEKKQISPKEAERMITPAAFFAKLLTANTVALSLMEHSDELGLKLKDRLNINVRSVNSYNNQFSLLISDLKKWKKAGYRCILLCPSRTRGERLVNNLMEEGLTAFFSENDNRELKPSEIMVLLGNALKGFEYPLQKFVVVTESDIFGQKKKKKTKVKHYDGKSIAGFSELSIGDHVVHEFHGLGIYRGIEKIERDGIIKDYIKIEYAKGDCLYVQASQIGTLQKYGSSDTHSRLKLNSLSTNEWSRTKSRVRKAVKDIAAELVKLYSIRQNSNGYSFGPDTVWQREFEEMFPFEETSDQLKAIEETKKDMESSSIMDRIVCGDVGYGKTEVALRAAFKAVQDSKQVVVLVPTTILAQQHYYTFMQRMKDFPVRVDLLCRFRTPAQQKKTIEDLKKGLVDIVIGTHRVLSKDIVYKDLGLLIIDEEQRFGVTHKEKIKQMRSKIDVLTLSATPIPRTLHMGLIGIRDMSVLEEPPVDRVPIQTYVMEYDDEIVREAISRELARDGQVYYVFNRVAGIQDIAARIAGMFPDAEVAFANGQMNERQLEQIMYRFINGEIDILVSTTIIETGMDISNVNTMIIHDADRFGLSQLYQLRGRIGRANRTAYAFLMYRKNKMLKEDAEKRLHAIREFSDLGSGMKIAMRDLEIRGAGNLLGAEQSGHMEDVGYDLYCKMLTEAVNEAKGIEEEDDFETSIDIKADAFIPQTYISNEKQRLEIYKKIAAVEDEAQRDEILEELIDRFSDPPKSVQNLLFIARLKAQAHRLYFTEIKQLGNEMQLSFYEKAKIKAENIPKVTEELGNRIKFIVKDGPRFIYTIPKRQGRNASAIEELREILEVCERNLV